MPANTMELLSKVERMIQKIAKRFVGIAGGAVELDDLVQVGRMAALKCAESYEADHNVAFRTYCWHPVMEEMRREATRSRSSATRSTGRCIAKDLSFSAPVGGADDETTLGDLFEDHAVPADERLAAAELERKVQRIVAKVRAEMKNPDLFDDLLERLMGSYFAGEGARVRSEVPLAAIAEKHGVSRQAINMSEKKIRAALTVALASVEG